VSPVTLAAVVLVLACASAKVNKSSGSESSEPCVAASVPDLPPDTVPAWFSDDSSWTGSGFRHLKHIIGVSFKPGTTPTQRRDAVAAVCGTVVGGWRVAIPDRGIYAVRVDDGDDNERIWQLIERLERLPQVRSAGVDPLLTVGPH
jgi:hypothetical protein